MLFRSCSGRKWAREKKQYIRRNRREHHLGCSECFGSARLYGRQDKTRQDGRNPAHHISRNQQNKTDRTRQYRTTIPASDASNVDYGRQDKTRQEGWNTTQDISRNRRDGRLGCVQRNRARYACAQRNTALCISRNRRSPPWMQRMLRKCKTMEDKTRDKRVDMHLEISHAEIDRENAAPQSEHLDQTHRPLPLPYEPLSVHTLFGKNTCVRMHPCVKAPVCKRSCV